VQCTAHRSNNAEQWIWVKAWSRPRDARAECCLVPSATRSVFAVARAADAAGVPQPAQQYPGGAIHVSGRLGVNILDENQGIVAERFASPRGTDNFAGLKVERGDGEVPLLADRWRTANVGWPWPSRRARTASSWRTSPARSLVDARLHRPVIERGRPAGVARRPRRPGSRVICSAAGKLFSATSNDLGTQFSYATDPDKVVIDLSAHIWGRVLRRRPGRQGNQARPAARPSRSQTAGRHLAGRSSPPMSVPVVCAARGCQATGVVRRGLQQPEDPRSRAGERSTIWTCAGSCAGWSGCRCWLAG
jgi:hypothetical protein